MIGFSIASLVPILYISRFSCSASRYLDIMIV